MTEPRLVFMVLSPRSLSYARDALESLFRNSLEVLQVRLITGSEENKQELSEAVALLDAKVHRWQVKRHRICAPFCVAIRAGAKSLIRC